MHPHVQGKKMESKKIVILIADDDLDEHGFMKEALVSLKHCELSFFLDAKGLLNYMGDGTVRCKSSKADHS
jgi:hypothetical protein